MIIEKILKRREKLSEDQIIFNESIIKTDEFTGLIEWSRISNIQTTALFLLKLQFENMDQNKIIEKVKTHISIGDHYHIVDTNPYITIYYDHQKKNSH